MAGTIGLLVRMVVAMGVVMGVMALAARYARHRQDAGAQLFSGRFNGTSTGRVTGRPGAGPAAPASGVRGRGPRRARPPQPVEIIFRRALAKGANITLVRAGGKDYLLGVTEQAVNLLAQLGTAEASPADSYPGTGETEPARNSPGEGTGLSEHLEDLDIWGTTGRTPLSLPQAATPGQPATAWKLAIDSLRERTVRR